MRSTRRRRARRPRGTTSLDSPPRRQANRTGRQAASRWPGSSPRWACAGRGASVSGHGRDPGAARSHRARHPRRARPCRAPARLHRAPGGQDLAGVLEEDHPVAEQTPALVWVGAHRPGRVPVRGIRARADRLVLTTVARMVWVVMGAARGAVAGHGGGTLGRGWADGAVRPFDARPRRPLKKTHLHGHQTLRLPVTAVTTTCCPRPRRVSIAGCKSSQTRAGDGRARYPNRRTGPEIRHRE
jgi:hypothetical protein